MGSNTKRILFISKNGSITRYLTSNPDNIERQARSNQILVFEYEWNGNKLKELFLPNMVFI